MLTSAGSIAHAWLAQLGYILIPAAALVAAAACAFFAQSRTRQAEKSDAPESSRIGAWACWATLAVGIFATLIASVLQRQAGGEQAQARFQSEVAHAENAVRARVSSYEELMHTVAAGLSGQRVDGSLWEKLVGPLRFQDRLPSIGVLGYAAHVPGDQLNRFLARVRSDTDHPMTIAPPGERFDYMIVNQISPSSSNLAWYGRDLGAELAARTAAERARDENKPILSARFVPLAEPGHRTLFFFFPIYSGNGEQAEDRQTSITGWVFERFRQEDFLKDILVDRLPAVAIQAYDGPELTPDSRIYDGFAEGTGTSSARASAFSTTQVMEVAGRHWTMVYGSTPAFEAVFSGGGSSVLWGTGLLLSLFGAAFVWALTSSRRRAYLLARQLTAASQQRLTALGAGPQGLVVVDATKSDLPIVYVNRSFERITGYLAREALGLNCRFLQGTDHNQPNLQELRRALREQRSCRVLLRNYRKDGTPFWNDLSVTPLRNEMGKVTQYFGVIQDVTEHEQRDRSTETQLAIIRVLAACPDLVQAAPRILQAICESQEWEIGTLWLLDRRDNCLRCLEIWHGSEIESEEFDSFSRQITYASGVGLPGVVWARAEAVWVADLTQERDLPEASLLTKQGMASACGFPIAGRDGLKGVFAFYSRKIWPLNKNLLLLMVGTGTQISQLVDREHTEIQQKELNALERGLAEYMGEGLIAMDRDGYCLYANAAASRMLGYQLKTILGENLHNLIHPPEISGALCQKNDCPILRSLENTQPSFVDDHQVFWRQDRSTLPVAYTTSPIVDEGKIRGVVITFTDATERRRAEDQLHSDLETRDREIAQLRGALEEAKQAVLAAPTEAAPEILPEAPAPEPEKPKASLVLLLEEDKPSRLRTQQTLRHQGYDVSACADASEALLFCERHLGEIALLITDVLLTQMTGKALADRLREDNPEMQVLFISTYNVKAVAELNILDPDAHFLRKPYSTDDLAEKVGALFPPPCA